MKNLTLFALLTSMALGFGAMAQEDVPPAPAASPAPAAGDAATATIIFFRPKKMMGAAVGFIVREGEQPLGKLRNGRYFSIQAAPGRHEYLVHSESKDALVIEVDAGETYYVQGTLGMGVMVGRPNLSPSDATTFESMKDKLRPADPLSKDKLDDEDGKAAED